MMRMVLALGVAAAGIVLACYPFITVSRLQQQVLDEVPLPEGAVVVLEGKPEGALRDDEFLLAFRGISSSIDEVEQALLDAGFQTGGPELTGSPTFGRACCGTYEGVLVSVIAGRDGITALRYTAANSAITDTWIFFTGFGALSWVGGIGLGVSATRRRPKSTARDCSGHNPIPAS